MTRALQLSDFTRNLNELVKKGKINRAFCRSKEIERTTQILLRRRKNNPVLLGEAGVGKTAIVEEIVHLIVDGKIHHDLSDCEIFELDTNALTAGSNKRGEYEKRALFLVEHFQNNENHILMIDEIHNIMRTSGGSESRSLGLPDILKPALARGDICCIGATTLDEYKVIIENDNALERRFMPVYIDEPDIDTTRIILNSVKQSYEKYHKCVYDSYSIDTILKVSDRYFHYRNFPDKALDLLDEIGSDNAMNRNMNPVRSKSIITKKDVLDFVSKSLKIPISDLSQKSYEKLSHIQEKLSAEIIGQSDAVQRVVKCIMRKECGMYSMKRPIASFLFYGKTGVGKTQLAKSLSEHYNYNTIKLDMSEYMESYAISSLIGSPPGYIGFENGGILTNAIKKNPYSVVIFDEIEKADPKIYNILLQIMEDGILTDNIGREYSFKNAIIIMTSNAGARTSYATKNMLGFSQASDTEEKVSHSVLLDYFRPELLNRIDEIVKFNSLNENDLKIIARKNIEEKIMQVRDNGYEIPPIDIDRMVDIVVSKSDGPRSIKSNIDRHFIDPLVESIMTV